MSTNDKSTAKLIALGLVGPFAALLIIVGLPVVYALYWMGRMWTHVPLVRAIFDEE
jgi:hypothetical protein